MTYVDCSRWSDCSGGSGVAYLTGEAFVATNVLSGHALESACESELEIYKKLNLTLIGRPLAVIWTAK
jgi:hypothetical protein